MQEFDLDILEALKTVDPPVLVGDNGSGQESVIITNAKGENLDGTSGPVWGEQGSPTDKSKYEKYK